MNKIDTMFCRNEVGTMVGYSNLSKNEKALCIKYIGQLEQRDEEIVELKSQLSSTDKVIFKAEGEFTKGIANYDNRKGKSFSKEVALFQGIDLEDWFKDYIYDEKEYELILRKVK